MDGQFQALIDAVDLARDERGVRSALKKFTADSGFDRYAYLQAHSNDILVFTDYPGEWRSAYFAKGYSVIDPVVSKAKRLCGSFAWAADEVSPSRLTSEERKFYSEAAGFGIRSGVTIPLEVSFGRTAMLTLASDRAAADVAAFRDPQRAATALAYVHLRLGMIAEGLFSSVESRLTPQEATCLNWSSLGKYMPEIAKIMGIEHRTVQYHLDNVREKLEATNLPHAVRLALEKHLIS